MVHGGTRRLGWLGRQLLREPLVLFFVVGAVLFVIAPRVDPGERVHLSRKSVRALVDA
jgi:hypothetical protein